MQLKNDWIQLQTDITPHKAALTEGVTTVRDEGVSNYPILFAYAGEENDHAPGIEVMQIPTNRGVVWNVNISTLEELVTKRIVANEKIDPFRKVYKNSPDALCFLIVDEEGARFGFVGEKQDDND
ncbi:hypothetical protein [Neolewinella antarctica]|uniref:Uncharacterized protein n=1 Tax=Neolewinella antarctica TaxID=442734 RepID=A0ABX0XCV9_9BACT|nr:hypothetical protein [Neolewinella antarctica]NJC27129.1 hypothetical protein [Neolewinella antarctica]